MKRFFMNLIPIVTYWVVFLLGYFIVLIGDLPTAYWTIPLLAVLLIIEVIIGYFIELKKIGWGVFVLGVQLSFCSLVQIVPLPNSIFTDASSTFFSIGNFVYSNVFTYDDNLQLNIAKSILSIFILIVPFFIGSFLRKRIQNKQGE